LITPMASQPPEKSTRTQRLSPIGLTILALSLAIFAIALCVNPGRENDLFWQLRTGAWILAHHQAPHVDMYSWTRRGTPWVAHEWLAFVVYSLCYSWKQFAGVWLLTAALTVAIMLLLYRLILSETAHASADRNGAPVTAFLIAAFASITADAFFQPRPQMFTYLFTLITLGIVQSVRRGSANQRIMWLLVPIFALWANLHAGVLVGVAILVILAMGDAAVDFFERQSPSTMVPRPWKSVAIVAVASLAATLLTPYGYHEYANFVATITNTAAMNDVSEWAAPNFHDAFGKLFEGFAMFILAGAFLTRLRHDPAEIALIALLGHEALTGSRNVPIFALVGSVLMARHLQSTMVRLLYGRTEACVTPTLPPDSLFGPSPSIIVVAAVSVAILFGAVMRATSPLRDFAGPSGSILDRVALVSIDYGTYPAGACAFIEREQMPLDLKMYNTYDDGGFVIWRMPNRPVFADSRADVYFGTVFDEVAKITAGTVGWQKIMDKYGVGMIVVSASEHQAAQYLAAPDWAVVYVDYPDVEKVRVRNNTLIFIKREPRYAALIRRCRRDCPAYAELSRRFPEWGAVH
jgi:hypothetical protein